MQKRVGILGLGINLPDKKLSNSILEESLNTSDEWIRERTGIRERYIADSGVTASKLAIPAIKEAIRNASLEPTDIDCIIVATLSPDMLFPATACLIQKELGIPPVLAFDVSAACSGFLYTLHIGASLIESNRAKYVLVVGTEVISKFIDWEDRNTAVLFGDGAGAAVLGEVPYPYGIISSYLKADGNGWNLLYLPGGGAAQPASFSSVENKLHYLKMEGKKLYECAIKRMQEAIEELLKSLNLKIEDISLFIAHQANIRIINSVASKLNLPNEKVFINLGKYGNTSAASLPIALYEAKKENRLNSGELVLLAAFGAGLTWGATLIHWH